MVRSSKIAFSVTPEACIGAAVILLTVPLRWVAAWVVAALVHEIGHCIMLYLCGKPILKISVGLNGAEIQAGVLSDGEMVLCALAGSAGGCLLLLLSSCFPRLALCAFLQSVYNLMPVSSLDGGRALRSLLQIVFPLWLADRICKLTEGIVLAAVLVLGCVASFVWKLGVMPVLFAVFFLLHTKKRKIPCK